MGRCVVMWQSLVMIVMIVMIDNGDGKGWVVIVVLMGMQSER